MRFKHILDQCNLFRGVLEIMIRQSLRRQAMHGCAQVEHTTRDQSNEPVVVEEGSLMPAFERLLRNDLFSLEAEWQVSATGRSLRTDRSTRNGSTHMEREVLLFNGMLKGVTLILAPAKS